MRLLFLLAALLFLSACTPIKIIDMPASTEEKSTQQIEDNQAEAQEAQDEYKKLQKQREQE